MKKKVLSLLLTLCLVMTFVPMVQILKTCRLRMYPQENLQL